RRQGDPGELCSGLRRGLRLREGIAACKAEAASPAPLLASPTESHKSMRDIDLIIFDCDGVLVDSEVISVRCLVEVLREAGVDIDTAAVIERFIGVARPEILDQVQAETRRRLPSDFLERLLDRIR